MCGTADIPFVYFVPTQKDRQWNQIFIEQRAQEVHFCVQNTTKDLTVGRRLIFCPNRVWALVNGVSPVATHLRNNRQALRLGKRKSKSANTTTLTKNESFCMRNATNLTYGSENVWRLAFFSNLKAIAELDRP